MSQPSRGDAQFRLAELTHAEVAGLASADTGRPVPVTGLSASPIDYDWGSPATAGLWRVDARGADGADRAYFVKLLRHPRLWPGLAALPDEESRRSFVRYFPWRFELDMYESGIADVLPPGLRVPVLHTVRHADADHIALWSEFVEQEQSRWQLSDYRRAAYLLGRLAARRRDGAAINARLPTRCRVGLPGESLRFYASSRVIQTALPAVRNPNLWRHPVIEAALRRVADPALPADMQALANRLPAVLDLLAGLPQTHAHGDASPQNLLRPAAETGSVVVIDWGFGDLLPIGFDLGQLLVGLAHAGETDPGELAAIDEAIYPGYLDGLADEDYDVDPRLVRTGYLGGLAVRSALCALPIEQLPIERLPPAEQTRQARKAEDGERLLALFATRMRLTRVMVDLAREVEPDVVARMPAGG
jgi:hypothetical protein